VKQEEIAIILLFCGPF